MGSMRFSIITPVYAWNQQKADELNRAIESIKNQDFPKEEIQHVIVNDGSPFPLVIPNYPWITVVEEPNLQRLTAYNSGFKAATGEVFCLLDSDDEYRSDYLQRVDSYYKDWPDYKLFNFGCTFIHKDGASNQRGPFKPKEVGQGHEVFGGGNIVNGTFVFSRDVYESLGAFPEGIKTIDVPWYKNTELFWTSPYDFSAYAQVEFPEIVPFFMLKHPDHPAGLPKELGNPYGNDFYLFYKYTRKYHSKPMDDFLYTVHLK